MQEKDIFDNIWEGIQIEKTPSDEIETQFAFERFKRRVRVNSYNRGRIWTQRIAAALFVPCLIGLAALFSLRKSDSNDIVAQLVEIRTGRGEIKRVVLPDSSIVVMNSQSRLVYPSVFYSQSRDIVYEGEGFFEISADPEHPFHVVSGDVTVKVLGTKFNFQAYSNEPYSELALFEGKVDFEYQKNEGQTGTISIVPGEKVQYGNEDGSVITESFEKDSYSHWRSGDCVFKDKTLGEIVRSLERKYDVQFVVTNEKLTQMSFYLAIVEEQSIDDLISLMNMDGRLKASRKGRIIEIK